MSRTAHSFLAVMTLVISIFVVSFAVLPVEPANAAETPTSPSPEMIAAVLRQLPENAVTLDFVLARAYHASDSVRTIKARKLSFDLPVLQSRALLDTVVTLAGNRVVDRNEPISPFQPDLLKTTVFLGEVSSYFRTGTRLAFSLQHEDGEIGIPAATIPPYKQTQLSLGIRQSLWRDSFGYASRLGLEAGEHLRKANQLQYRMDLENWTVDLIRLYYQAWFTQRRLEAAREGLKRKKRLVSITGVKQRRGTAETPDVLQAGNAFVQAEVELSNSEQALNEIWRNLVVSLNLPEAWLAADPSLIPMKAEDSVPRALNHCFAGSQIRPAPKSAADVEYLEKLARAGSLNARRSNNLAKPDLSLNLVTVSNGADATGNGRSTFSETLSWEHPEYQVGLSLSIPLGNSAARAELLSARTNQVQAEAQYAFSRSGLVARWLNGCSQLKRLSDQISSLERTLKEQNRRVSLEERRFEVGKVPLLNVIQAGDDATGVEVQLRSTQAEAHIAAWNIIRLASNLMKYIERLPDPGFKMPENP